MSDDVEMEDRQLFGLHFKCTDAEQRRLWMRLTTSAESREWGIARNLMNLTVAPVPMPVHLELAERMEKCEQAMTRLSSRLIEELIKERA